MTVSLESRISYLLPEFFADALILFCPLQTAGTVSPCSLQTVFDHLYHLFVFIQTNCHTSHFPSGINYTTNVNSVIIASKSKMKTIPKG